MKQHLKDGLTHLELKLKDIMHTMEFFKQYFRSEIEDANQNITFCGVGYYHQNVIFERKIQNIALGARTFLLHEKYIGQGQ